MEIIVGDVHGSIEQFLYPFYSNGFYDSANKVNNEIVFEHLDLHNNRIIFIGDIFYKGIDDITIANTLSKLVLERNDIEWILGNRDLLIFAKCFIDDLQFNESYYSFKDSPFSDIKSNSKDNISKTDSKDNLSNETKEARFNKLNKNNIKRLILEHRVKIITRLKNNILVSHAAITQDGINELKYVLDTKDISNVINPEVLINNSSKGSLKDASKDDNLKDIYKSSTVSKTISAFKNNSIEFNNIEDLNYIFTDVNNIILYCLQLKIFWNKHIFEAIEESVIGHETFINEYPEEAINKIQKYGTWLTDEYISMNIQCKNDRMNQFLLTKVHYNGIEINTNIHHTDCNCYKYKNPCCFAVVYDNNTSNNSYKWMFLGADKEFKYKMINYEDRQYKVLVQP